MKGVELNLLRFGALIFIGIACSSAPRVESNAEYSIQQNKIHAPFPAASDVLALHAFFERPEAPNSQDLAQCDFDYRAEQRFSQGVREGLFRAFPQYVGSSPEKYHWCFYWNLLALEESKKSPEADWDRLRFLTDLARVFEVDYDEPRYLRDLSLFFQRMSKERYGTELKARLSQ